MSLHAYSRTGNIAKMKRKAEGRGGQGRGGEGRDRRRPQSYYFN